MAQASTSQRGNALNYSSIRKLLPYAKKAIESGVNVIKLNIGDPDLKTPKEFLNVLKNWDINHGVFQYGEVGPEFIASYDGKKNEVIAEWGYGPREVKKFRVPFKWVQAFPYPHQHPATLPKET